MGAAGHVDHAPGNGANPSGIGRSHPPPAYAHRPTVRQASARRHSPSRRGWTAQLAQWALVFGVLGLLIGGAKWWDRHRGVELPVQATVTATETLGPADTAVATATSPAPSGEVTGR